MVVDIVKGRERWGVSVPVGWKITDELVTLEPIKVLSTTADSTLSWGTRTKSVRGSICNLFCVLKPIGLGVNDWRVLAGTERNSRQIIQL